MFRGDLLGGLTVGIVALPLAIALAIASGVKPEQGLYTAIFAGASHRGPRRHANRISGPTGAFIVIVYGIVQKYGYDGLAVATLIAGILLVIMGLARMGALLKFVPYPVTVGFTAGIALIIFSSQVSDLLGLRIEKVPADFVEKWIEYGRHITTVNPVTIAVGGASLLIIVLWNRSIKKVPGQLVAIIAVTFVVQYFALPVETVATRFGGVPSGIPSPRLPAVTWELVQQMFSPAVTIAILAGLESLLSAVVADGMTGNAAPLEHGANWPGSRQYRVCRFRRNSCHRCDRPNSYQYKKRGQNACCRTDPLRLSAACAPLYRQVGGSRYQWRRWPPY